MNKRLLGHFYAFFCMYVWGTTFVSTKVLLGTFDSIEIFFYRTAIALLVLFAYTRINFIKPVRNEWLFVLLGLFGNTLYFFTENKALSYTQASSVSFLLTTAPLFTAIFISLFYRKEKAGWQFYSGFIVSMIGVFIVIYSGMQQIDIHPIGDLLAILAAVTWGIYSLLVKKLQETEKQMIIVLKTFYYGMVTSIPFVWISGTDFLPNKAFTWSMGINLLFLGVIASCLCFVLWNEGIRLLGAVKSSVYLYLMPFVTAVTAWLFIDEKIGISTFVGGVIIIGGVVVSEGKSRLKTSPDEKVKVYSGQKSVDKI